MWGLLLFFHSLPLRWWLEDCRNLNLFIYISVLSSLLYVFVFVCVNIFLLPLSVRFSSSFHVILLLSSIGVCFLKMVFITLLLLALLGFITFFSRGFLVPFSFLTNHYCSFLSHLLPCFHIASLVLCVGHLQYISHRVHLILLHIFLSSSLPRTSYLHPCRLSSFLPPPGSGSGEWTKTSALIISQWQEN